MLISASYRTDIPAFYGGWFANRLRAGYCKTYNVFSHRVSKVLLTPEAVDGFVFWTKNVGPFTNNLTEVHRMGIPFVVQHTITGYPRELEPSVTPAEKATQRFRQVAEVYGPDAIVWRYDPIVLSSITPPRFHVENFDTIATDLEGATNEVVVSFAQMYRKTERNLDTAAREHGFTWEDPDNESKRELLMVLSRVAGAHGMRLTLCSQPDLLAPGVQPAACVDTRRLGKLAGHSIVGGTHGNRPGCMCARSVDIGAYDTCPHGCVYCYAVQSQRIAKAAYRRHDPEGEFLFPPDGPIIEDEVKPQLELFET